LKPSTRLLLEALYNIGMLLFLVYLAVTRDGAEGAVWTVGILVFLCLVAIERVERAVKTNPITYAIYIDTEDPAKVPELVRKAMENSPYRKA
jgi:hypothetical protein